MEELVSFVDGIKVILELKNGNGVEFVEMIVVRNVQVDIEFYEIINM